ncbi:uncharacterized protein LOC141762991 [Sebastes fasciatus]|uniref:uncharacterized protein LOC141762991 n=1 Tax=Sebastes fasciatus TaxID=394691 RepID=UPI003D9E5606
MDPLWLILSLVLVSCAEAENLTEVKVTLGQTATLDCSNVTKAVYWYIEIRSQVKGIIAKAFDKGPKDVRFCDTFTNQTKYIAMGNQMNVTNVTAEDHRLYFCGSKTEGETITIVETFRLRSDVPITPSTNDSNQQQHSCTRCPGQLVVYGSFALNGVLVLVITGLLCTLQCWKRKKNNDEVNEPSPLTYEDPQTLETPQYEEIQLRSPPPASPPPECIYHKAQRPRPTASPHH